MEVKNRARDKPNQPPAPDSRPRRPLLRGSNVGRIREFIAGNAKEAGLRRYAGPLVLFSAIVGLQFCYWWAISARIEDVGERGLFGDMFGGFTALASGLAFAGMIYAIVLQSRELALQRQELKLTREEMVAARAEYARSAQAQQELVEKQMLTARMQGVATLVQVRYQVAAARGANVHKHLDAAREAEARLLELLEEAGVKDLNLPDVR